MYSAILLWAGCYNTYKSEPNGTQTVYITRTGEKYHNRACQHLAKSKFEISLESAYSKGYRACAVCDPPRLITEEDVISKSQQLYPFEMIIRILLLPVIWAFYLSWVIISVTSIFINDTPSIKALGIFIYISTVLFLVSLI